MNDQILAAVTQQSQTQKLPVIKTGMTLKVSQEIVEGKKKRIQVFEGLVIKTQGRMSLDGTFTVRRNSQGIGVEKTFPLLTSNLKKIEIVKQAKIRRSKLYFMRERAPGKASRLKGKHLQQVLFDAQKKVQAQQEEKAPAAQAKPAAKSQPGSPVKVPPAPATAGAQPAAEQKEAEPPVPVAKTQSAQPTEQAPAPKAAETATAQAKN